MLKQSSVLGLPSTPPPDSLNGVSNSRKKPIIISEILEGGEIIVLSDNSKWDVDPNDVDVSGGWLGPAEVEVVKMDTNTNYPYQITNNWTQSFVMARPHPRKRS